MSHETEQYKYHNWRLCQLSLDLSQSVVSHFPLEIQVEVTTYCNLACTMCVRPFVSPRPTHIPYEVLSKLFPIFPVALKLVPFGGGEPLLYPHFIELVERAKQSGVKVVFNTNGSLLTEEISRILVSNSVDMVSISLDAATEETYRAIRLGAEFSKVINNISALNAVKGEQSKSLPKIGLAYVPMVDNVGEIPLLLSLAREIGAQHITFEALYVPDPKMNPAYKQFFQNQTLSNLPENELITLFKECDRLSKQLELSISPPDYFSRWLPINVGSNNHNEFSIPEKDASPQVDAVHISSASASNPVTCTSPWTSIYVNTNGLVQTCCFSSRVFGDLKTQELAEIWNGAQFRAYRQQFIQGNYPSECKVCLENSRNKTTILNLSTRQLWRSWDAATRQTLPIFDEQILWSAWSTLTNLTLPYFHKEFLFSAWKRVSQEIFSRFYHRLKPW